MAWEPYAQGFGKIKSVYDIERLYYNELTAELKEFKLEAPFYLTVSGEADLCLGIGWNLEAIEADLTMTSHFDECEKVIINDLFDYEGVFKGKTAKWFENCEDTEDVTANFVTWEIQEALPDRIWLGTKSPESTHCNPIPFLSSWLANLSSAGRTTGTPTEQELMSRLFNYLRPFDGFKTKGKSRSF